MVVIFKNIPAGQADVYGLVLSSSGIPHRLIKGEDGWDILVNDAEYKEALDAIEKYLKENQDFHQGLILPGPVHLETFTGLWVSGVLLACHIAIALGHDREFFVRAYGSSAFHVLHGELYRSVTSLMIHADALHLTGNILGIAIFGTAVCGVTGLGLGWFMILITGILGNLANAALYKTGHLSVGASTAVFGAIGILSGQQFFTKFRLGGQRMRAWLPLGGGLALLSILGSGEHTDLMAHLFGFLAGTILGVLYGIFVKRPMARSYQTCFLLMALSILVISWMRAFGHG